MSDLFKDHKPELSDDEDRRLWQRVRAIPGEGLRPAPVPWWRALWAMPAVRYGAPAFAVLVAAVVWVTERGPQPTLEVEEPARVSTRAAAPPADQPAAESPAPGVRRDAASPSELKDRMGSEEAPLSTAREVAPPTDKLHALGSSPEDRKAQARKVDERQEAAQDQAARGGAAPEPTVQQQEQVIVAPPAKTMALKKGEPAPTAQSFAAPPKEAAKNSAPTPGANWGAVKSNYRDSGSASGAPSPSAMIVEGLDAGALPGTSALATHALIASVADAARLGPLSGRVSFPDEALGDDGAMVAVLEIAGSGRIEARSEKDGARARLLFSEGDARGEPMSFESAPPRLQVAVLAFALERALATPGTPRDRLENLLELSKKIARRAGPDARPGADRLTRMIEGALRTWPRD